MQETAAGRIARGALAGIGATVTMTASMIAAERAGWMSELPPARITRRALDDLPAISPAGATPRVAVAALHLGIGAGAGAAYALGCDRQPLRVVPSVIRGLAFGTLLWATAYAGVLPAIGLMPPPADDERRRPLAMLIAHWVYGATLALLHERR